MAPKIECKMEFWWLNSVLSEDGILTLHGNIYNYPAFKDGEFVALTVERVNMINSVAETSDAIIKLGTPESVDRILGKMEERKK